MELHPFLAAKNTNKFFGEISGLELQFHHLNYYIVKCPFSYPARGLIN